MNLGMLFCIIACLSFGVMLYAAGIELNAYIRGKLRQRKALKNQKKAIGVAENLIVFDQTMTRDALFRDYAEIAKHLDRF